MNTFKVALVEASAVKTHVYSRTYLPRTGIPTLGAILKQRGVLCDLFFQTLGTVEADRLAEYDLVGIGSLTSTVEGAYRLADAVRARGTTVVMGGPHATFMPEEALGHCDYVVIGEGDVSFPALVEALAAGQAVEHLPGIACKGPDGNLRVNDPAPLADFSSLPSPDFTLSPQIDPAKIPPIITTSRGCPHNCTFCSVTSMFGRKYRFKSNEQVISEIRPIQHRSICFGDDNFCAKPSRTKSLLRAMIDQDAVPLRWSGEMCVGAGQDLELLDLMQQTRCRIVYVGIESVIPETLKEFGKAHQVEAIARCIDNLHDRGIGIHGMFVVGPENTPDHVKRIVDYAIEHDIDTIQVFSLIPFPGTEAHEQYSRDLLHHEWDRFEGLHVLTRPRHCEAHQLQMAIANQMLRFYGPGRVLTSYRRGRAWRIKYRAGGHFLMKKWLRENQDYFEKLRSGFY